MDQKDVKAWQKLYRLLSLERKEILQVLYYAIFAGIISLVIPLGVQAIINYLQGAQVTVSWIILTVVVTVGVGFVGFLRILQLKVIEDIQLKIFTRTAFEFTYRFPNIRVRELEKHHPAELANRFFDTPGLQKGVQKLLLDFPAAFLQIILGVILISFYHSFFILFGILIVLMFYLLFKFTNKKATITSIKESGWKYKVAFWIQQVASQFKNLKIKDNEYEFTKLNYFVENYLNTRKTHFKIIINQYTVMVIFQVIITIAFLLIGGFFVLNQEMNIGQFVAAEIIIVGVINSIEKLGQILESIYDMVASVDKISHVTDKKLDAPLVENAVTPTIFPLKVKELKTVHNGNHHFEIEQYGQYNLVGHQLEVNQIYYYLAGMKRTTDGKILLKNEEIKSVDLKKYQAEIGLALNADELFEGTLWENLTLKTEAKKPEVIELLNQFGILEEIQNLPHSLETLVFSRAEILSKRSSQLVCLLRSLLKNPQLLMVEDGFIISPKELNALMNYCKEHQVTLLLASPQPLNSGLETINV